ncbi:hypothetical protein LLS1_14400 [Leifsonia sp. LS1]|uniref:hypothetical protein n=1 Tax=Leifsonia sp. LS1 TaxID=2828483 RepID=UPI001CFD3F4E|nr:hypothetical protein [Leifsonia sp. LS1]GIT79771.1 hypothetical protein LLS1_14400 [Leifsonia sp. LS1]
MSTVQDIRTSRGDRVSIVAFIAAGVLLAAWSVIAAAVAIAEAAGNRDVRVLADFAGTPAQAPIGPGGAAREVELVTAYVTAPQLPAASFAALILREALGAGVVVAIVVCLVWLALNVLRGRIFSRTNTTLVATATIGGLIAWAAIALLNTMVANGAIARISDRDFDNPVMSLPLQPLLLLAFAASIVVTAFTVGDRMRRDTEGLV